MVKKRGKELEKKINEVNLKYRKEQLAIIYNLPLPVKITDMGLLPQQSTVDYIGSIGPEGKAIAFDTKETQSTTSFPLANIHDHQILFLTYYLQTGAKAGFLIWFKNLDSDEAFFVPISFLNNFIETETRKSIPYKTFKAEWRVPLDDYLNLFKNNE